MGLYESLVLPRLIDWTMRSQSLSGYRERLVGRARGCVLEIGFGSGLNLPFYGERVEHVIGLDPSAELLSRAVTSASRRPVTLLQASAEAIPLRAGVVDTIVMTWSLCSMSNAQAALAEMRRVLRKDGELIFVEHGLAPDPAVAKWQRWLNPVWAHVSCQLANPVTTLIEEAGFELCSIDTGYLGSGPKPMTFMYEGWARPK